MFTSTVHQTIVSIELSYEENIVHWHLIDQISPIISEKQEFKHTEVEMFGTFGLLREDRKQNDGK